jgi:hypothetical protein
VLDPIWPKGLHGAYKRKRFTVGLLKFDELTVSYPGHIRSERSGGKGHHRRRGVSDARQRSGGVEKYSSIASRQAPEHGSTASSWGPDWRISAAIFSAQLMQTPARSIPQPVQLQFDL